MKHNHLERNVVEAIEAVIAELYKESPEFNKVLKDDIFSLLETIENVNVCYFPIENHDVNGMHIERTVNGRKEDFVYINSANAIEKQVYCAAHEYGHMLNVPEKVKSILDACSAADEDIINRFAAELLMPKDIFKNKMKSRLCDMGYTDAVVSIKTTDLIRLIVYLMNEFMTPFKAIVLRMEELKEISAQVMEYLEDFEEENRKVIQNIIQEGKYMKLNQPNQRKAMGKLVEYLRSAEEMGLLNEHKIRTIRNCFDISENDIVFEKQQKEKMIEITLK